MNMILLGFPGGSDGKEFACNAEDLGSIPGLGRYPGGGHGNPFQYSCLGNPMDRAAWWATIHGVTNYPNCKWIKCTNQKTQTGWVDTKIRPVHMLSTRDSLQTQGHLQTESKGMGEGIPHKWKS